MAATQKKLDRKKHLPTTTNGSDNPWKANDGQPDWEAVHKTSGRRTVPARVKQAIVDQLMSGAKNAEMAEGLGIKSSTYSRYKSAKEGQAFRKKAEELLNEPETFFKYEMREQLKDRSIRFGMYIDILEAQGNIEAAAKYTLKLFELVGFPEKASILEGVDNASISITIVGKTAEEFLTSPADMVETSYEIVNGSDREQVRLPAG